MAIMLVAVSSYFSSPIPSGAGALNTSPQQLQRRRSSSTTLAESGDMPTTRTSTAGSARG